MRLVVELTLKESSTGSDLMAQIGPAQAHLIMMFLKTVLLKNFTAIEKPQNHRHLIQMFILPYELWF